MEAQHQLDLIKTIAISWGALFSTFTAFVAWLAFRQNRKAAHDAVRPVMVMTRMDDSRWTLQNVGNGPALNVKLAFGGQVEGASEICRHYPFPVGASRNLRYVYDPAQRFLAEYQDIRGKWHRDLRLHAHGVF